MGMGFMKMRMNTMSEQQRNLKKNGGQFEFSLKKTQTFSVVNGDDLDYDNFEYMTPAH